MILFYGFALIPALLGIFIWKKFKAIVLFEYFLSIILSIGIAALCHLISFNVKTIDFETISGKITAIKYIPEWTSKHEQRVYKTDSNGERIYSHSYYTYRKHAEKWLAELDFGYYRDSFYEDIDKPFYDFLKLNFNTETKKERGYRSNFSSGDRNDYINNCVSNYVYPVTISSGFKNKIKASPSLYSFAPIDPHYKKHCFEYPKSVDIFKSNHVLGISTNKFDILEWDRLCTKLGSTKKVNLIIVGFENHDMDIAINQEAFWLGGKKNDLVMCYGQTISNKLDWSYVFGWTDEELVKKNIQKTRKIDHTF